MRRYLAEGRTGNSTQAFIQAIFIAKSHATLDESG
jgi:hypothetical protein